MFIYKCEGSLKIRILSIWKKQSIQLLLFLSQQNNDRSRLLINFAKLKANTTNLLVCSDNRLMSEQTFLCRTRTTYDLNLVDSIVWPGQSPKLDFGLI